MSSNLAKKVILNSRGNSILIGVIATTVLAITAVMMSNGYLSSLKFKNKVEQKASVSQIENAFLVALSKASFYYSTASAIPPNKTEFISGMLGGSGLDIAGVGKAVEFSYSGAEGLGASDSNAQKAREECNKPAFAPKVPDTATSPADFIFCLKFQKAFERGGENSFFSSDVAFGVVKVSLKKRSGTQKELLTTIPTWQDFYTNADRNLNFQADIYYTLFWGKKNDSTGVFEKSGNALKDLR